jgi:hypothetical protein
MKRILLLIVIALGALPALAAEAADRDVLILTDGTVYSIEAVPYEDGVTSSLVLTRLAGGNTTTSVVPESTSGKNSLPTLAYDDDSNTLYVVWMRVPNAKTNELLVAGFSNGKWHSAIAIDSKPVVRSNLSIRFTRQILTLRRDGSYSDGAALILHAAWWEKDPNGEGAFYAVMPLSQGLIQVPDVHDLADFANLSTRAPNSPVDEAFMRQVSLVDGPTLDSVDAIFADSRTDSFYRATLRPVAETRVHITVGVKGPSLGAPKVLSFPWAGRPGTITSPDGQTVIFTNTTETKVSWVTYRNGDWMDVREIALSDKVTVNVAMSALSKMAQSASAAAAANAAGSSNDH